MENESEALITYYLLTTITYYNAVIVTEDHLRFVTGHYIECKRLVNVYKFGVYVFWIKQYAHRNWCRERLRMFLLTICCCFVCRCTRLFRQRFGATSAKFLTFSTWCWIALSRLATSLFCTAVLQSLPHLLLFITFSLFPFFIHFTYFLLLSIRSISTRIVPLRFQAWGCRRRPNLGLVCFCVMIMLSVLLS